LCNRCPKKMFICELCALLANEHFFGTPCRIKKNTGKGLWSNLQNVNKNVMVIHQNNMLGKFPTFDLKYVYSLYFKANALNSYYSPENLSSKKLH